MRVAGTNDPEHAPGRLADTPPAPPQPGRRPPRARSLREGRRRATVLAQGALLAAAVVATVLVSEADQWTPLAMVGLLAVLVLGSDFIALDAKRFRIGGSFLGIVLAMATLGPAPAVALGLAATLVDGLRSRPRPRGTYLLNNLATHATFPLLGGLALTALHQSPTVGRAAYALAVFAVFIGAN